MQRCDNQACRPVIALQQRLGDPVILVHLDFGQRQNRHVAPLHDHLGPLQKVGRHCLQRLLRHGPRSLALDDQHPPLLGVWRCRARGQAEGQATGHLGRDSQLPQCLGGCRIPAADHALRRQPVPRGNQCRLVGVEPDPKRRDLWRDRQVRPAKRRIHRQNHLRPVIVAQGIPVDPHDPVCRNPKLAVKVTHGQRLHVVAQIGRMHPGPGKNPAGMGKIVVRKPDDTVEHGPSIANG